MTAASFAGLNILVNTASFAAVLAMKKTLFDGGCYVLGESNIPHNSDYLINTVPGLMEGDQTGHRGIHDHRLPLPRGGHPDLADARPPARVSRLDTGFEWVTPTRSARRWQR